MMLKWRRYDVTSTSVQLHVPAGNLAPVGPPNILNLPTPMCIMAGGPSMIYPCKFGEIHTLVQEILHIQAVVTEHDNSYPLNRTQRPELSEPVSEGMNNMFFSRISPLQSVVQ